MSKAKPPAPATRHEPVDLAPASRRPRPATAGVPRLGRSRDGGATGSGGERPRGTAPRAPPAQHHRRLAPPEHVPPDLDPGRPP